MNALLCPVGDAGTLAKNAVMLLDDEPMWTRISEAGRRTTQAFDPTLSARAITEYLAMRVERA